MLSEEVRVVFSRLPDCLRLKGRSEGRSEGIALPAIAMQSKQGSTQDGRKRPAELCRFTGLARTHTDGVL